MVIWESQSVQDRKQVTCLAPTAVSPKTQNPTCNREEEGWEENYYPAYKSQSARYYGAAEIAPRGQGVAGLLLSGGRAPPAYAGARLRRPRAQGRALGPHRSSAKRLGRIGRRVRGTGCRLRGARGAGRAGRRGAASLPFDLGLPRRPPGPGPGQGGPQGGALAAPRLAPAPGRVCRSREVLASPSGGRGSPGLACELGLAPSCLTVSSRPRNAQPCHARCPIT